MTKLDRLNRVHFGKLLFLFLGFLGRGFWPEVRDFQWHLDSLNCINYLISFSDTGGLREKMKQPWGSLKRNGIRFVETTWIPPLKKSDTFCYFTRIYFSKLLRPYFPLYKIKSIVLKKRFKNMPLPGRPYKQRSIFHVNFPNFLAFR